MAYVLIIAKTHVYYPSVPGDSGLWLTTFGK